MKYKIKEEIESKTLEISRVTRVTGGGKKLSFRAVVVVGDRKGNIGLGVEKGKDVSLAIEKAIYNAKKNMINISILNNGIPYSISAKIGLSKILIKPQFKGKGIVAGGIAGAICELAGIKDISCKILSRSKNKLNNARAIIKCLSMFNQ